MNFTLTILASPELQAVLEKLASFRSETATEGEEPKTRKPRTPKDIPAAPAPAAEDDGLGDDPPVVHTAESIRALGKDRATIVGAEKVRELIKSLGFESIKNVTPDKYAEFVEKVNKLTK